MVKRFWVFLMALLALTAACVTTRPTPTPTVTPTPITVDYTPQCRAIWKQELERDIDAAGLTGCLEQFRRGDSSEAVRAGVRLSSEYARLQESKRTRIFAPLTTDRKVFLESGQPWRWRGVSAFKLAHHFEAGRVSDVDDFLRAYAGYNILRVWDYTPVDPIRGDGRGWEGAEWGSASLDAWVKFLAHVGRQGFRVELTLLTDDDPARIPAAIRLVQGIAKAGVTNVLFEAGNEPLTNKRIDVEALRPALEAAGRAGYLYTSGVYEDTRLFYGTYGVYHSGRDNEWTRRGHDALDYFNGGGPNFPEEPARPVPWVGDEPGKYEDVGIRSQDWRAYVGVCSLLGAGFTFHSNTGKLGQFPTETERALISTSLQALNAFPDGAPNGPYARPSDDSLRTYVVGPWAVRVRPQTTAAPFSGTPLDGYGILWSVK